MNGLRFLPPFASWLPCHMDGGRRHKILGSEMKNFITHGTASSMQFKFMFISSCNPNSSETRQRGPCEGQACRGFAFQLRSSGLREPKSFIKDICTKRRHHSTRQKTKLQLFQGHFLQKHPGENGPEQKWLVPLLARRAETQIIVFGQKEYQLPSCITFCTLRTALRAFGLYTHCITQSSQQVLGGYPHFTNQNIHVVTIQNSSL